MWRIVFDERTRIPVHVLEENYRLEDLDDYHVWLDFLDLQREKAEAEAEAKRKRNS